eukprot:CAMPEP_0194119382 /NCGR_PEP_ID=MMETSP0150-20130528/39120_1 /TAXON_ID=122233 /ORGANISM="Chaetoceros debilis, Strain MM31A-1" /LENGTH=64 /DNA_ID=CAMNT_0038811069 /DNA_START=351 /DNA_END=545 /DNA_ORIENTATION=+
MTRSNKKVKPKSKHNDSFSFIYGGQRNDALSAMDHGPTSYKMKRVNKKTTETKFVSFFHAGSVL